MGIESFEVTALDGTTRTLNTLRWFDRPDAGRYLTIHGATSTACPADAAILVAALLQQFTALGRRAS